MQRISDIMWMTRGVVKVGQTFIKSSCDGMGQAVRSCSIVEPFMEQCNQFCGKEVDSMYDEHTFHDDNMTDDHSIINEDSEEDSSPPHSSEAQHPSSNGLPDQTKRHFSTFSSAPLLSQRQNLFQLKNNKIFFHTSAISRALTAEELAAIAQVKQSRQSKSSKEQKNPLNMNKPQHLSSQSREKRVPSSRIGRISSFGGLAAGLAMGTLSEYARKSLGYAEGDDNSNAPISGSSFLNEANLGRIVNTLCTVRGAALKLGQMLSIQDASIVNPKLLEVFDRVRQSADFMPVSQMKKVLVQEFGEDWQSRVKEFDEKPFAAASIGQVHRAVLHDGRVVAMKIQYPGVADSINSDIDNLVTLLKFWKVFPEQMFMDKFIDVARVELALECDYIREAEFSQKFRAALIGEEMYGVPQVISELSGKKVLTTELITGIPVDEVTKLSQDERNFIAAAILRLVLREIFEFRCMQTDPNWSNFFYNEEKQKIWLLDFGASRYYSKKFVDEYIEVVKGAATGDREKVLKISHNLGFLTGYESKIMEEAHVDAIMILGEPFSTDDVFDFGMQNTSNRIVKLVPTFLKHRLAPPPEETYSLHRKLSGAFLIATKLKAKFACKKMFDDIYENYFSGNANEELP